MLLGPVMAIGWMGSALMRYFILQTSFTIALIIGACLTPTDLVLAASVVGEAHFLQRVPNGSGCNDSYHFNFYLPTYLLPRPQRLVLGHHILAMLY